MDAAIRTIVLAALVAGWPAAAVAHGDLHDQIDRATIAIREAPQDAGRWLARGELYRAHHDPDRALADYARALRVDPSLDAAYLARGRLQLEAGRPAQALADLDRFLARVPGHADAYALRARAHDRLGALAASVRDYDAALAVTCTPDWTLERARVQRRIAVIGPRHALAGLKAARACTGPIVTLEVEALDIERDLGLFDDALSRLARLQSIAPRADRWLVRRGEILRAAGRPEEAVAAFRGAIAAIDELPLGRRRTRLVQAIRAAALAGLRDDRREP